MNCKVKKCCAALAARRLAEQDPAIVEITRGGKNKSHHVLRKSDMKKVGLIAGGAFVALTALNVYSHYKLHQAIADRKVKKQLEPMRAELEAAYAERSAPSGAGRDQAPPARNGSRTAATGTGI